MPTNAIKKQLHLYFGVDGTLLDKSGDVFANPQDDETFEINAYIEDGVANNQTTLINFTPNDRVAYTSHWFTMFYRELVEYIVPSESEPRIFAKFTITVPSIVLLIKGGKVQFEQRITIIQRYGNTHLGNFATVTDLNVAYPPSETLDDNNDVAFVYSNESGETAQVGFYQVEYDGSNYAWIKKETLLYNLQTKQYNVLGFTVNVGMANPSGVPTISESVIYQLMQEISYLDVEATSLRVDLTALEVRVSNTEDEIILLEQRLEAHLEDVDNPHGVTAEQVDTYVKTTIDNKDTTVLTEAKAYTDILGIVVEQNKQDIAGINEGLVKIDDETITKNDEQELKVSDLVINDINSRVKETDFIIYQNIVQDILNGTTVVKKAEQDENGNNIKDTYATVTYVDGKISGVFRPSGNWNANTNTPTLANNEPTNAGKVYYVTNAGTQFGLTFAIGDKLAFIESGVATKWDNVDDVTSVNGKVGTVVINADDIPFNGSGTNYLTAKTEVESAVKELDTRVKSNADNVALKVNISDIVDNLTTNDATKVLSAKQGKVLNDNVALKVDKVTGTSTTPQVYGKDASGNQTMYNLAIGLNIAGAIVLRDAEGRATVHTPTTPNHATNKKYVDDEVALRVKTSDIVNNLTSTDTNKPLSANQGKVLKDLVDTTVGNIDAILNSILGV